MNKKTAVILAGVLLALIGVVVLTLYLIQGQQDTRSRASEEIVPTSPVSQTTQACPVPAAVQNVLVEFPNCEGDVCNFTQARCTWSSVAGAAQYQIKVTEVDTTTVIKNQPVEASVTKLIFPVIQNRTYQCDVSATNSCGTTGPAGSHSLLCEVDAAIATPTLPPPIPTPLPKVECGFLCTVTDNCKSGLVCAINSGGQGLCSLPSLSSACQTSPSISSCCSTPTSPLPTAAPFVKPTLPPTGNFDSVLGIGAGALMLILLGGALLIW